MEEQPEQRVLSAEKQALIREIDLNIEGTEHVLAMAGLAIERATRIGREEARRLIAIDKKADEARAVLRRAGLLID